MDGELPTLNGSKEKILISIVVPVYNVEAYVAECLDSLCAQTYEDIEILLVDDGSSDRSGEICDSYAQKDERIRVFHTVNSGVSEARNRGIEEAEGDYLVFVDSDDKIHPQLLKCYIECLDSNCVLLCGMTETESELKQMKVDDLEQRIQVYDLKHFAKIYAENLINSPVNKLYRLDILRKYKIRFPEGMNMGEDLLFNLDYLRQAPTQYKMMELPFYYYRQDRDGSLTAAYRKDLFQIQQELAAAVEQFMKDMQVWNPENQRIHYGLYWDRLYMTASMCRSYEKEHKDSRKLKQILNAPVWGKVWIECRKRKLCTWKRRIKKLSLTKWKIGW